MGTGFDSTRALLREGYEFGERRFEAAGRDAIATRIMLRRTVIIRGAAAAERFSDSRSFVRDGAVPRRMRQSFIGEGGVQSLDGDEHRQRKAMFMDLMSPEGLDRLEQLAAGRWTEAIRDWAGRDDVVLLEAVSELLCRAACDWVGVDLPADQVRRRTAEFLAMIDSPAALGSRHRRGRLARRSSERWIREELHRAGDDDRPIDRFARALASDEDGPGEQIAAVEVINLLRPIVAVGRYVAFAAAALQEHPTWRDRLHDDPAWIPSFVHEVRRTAPFVPMIAAVSTTDVELDGLRVAAGTRVVLDLYATNRDPRRWHRPDVFDPRRHHAREASPFDLVPQGVGDHHRGHRCAGEWATIRLMEQAVHHLLVAMSYDVPPQDLSVPLDRIPTAPVSGVRLTNVTPLAEHSPNVRRHQADQIGSVPTATGR